MLHRFTTSITDIPLPERFTYPFCYTPHPLCILAAKEVQSYLTRQTAWKDELRQGKMFGVLIVQTEHGETGYLAAFSGILAGKNLHPFFGVDVLFIAAPVEVTCVELFHLFQLEGPDGDVMYLHKFAKL